MLQRYKKSYIDLETFKNSDECAKNVLNCLKLALEFEAKNGESFESLLVKYAEGKLKDEVSPKKDLEFKEEEVIDLCSIVRSRLGDRSHKLETLQLNVYSGKHNKSVNDAMIHTGMAADEYARSFNALAFTVGKHIYFRNGAYRPETEEGRKLLAHELTHVHQNENKEDYRNVSRKELEAEALASETAEVYDPDPFVDYEVDGRIYKLRKSQVKKVEVLAEEKLEHWVMNQEYCMSEEEYLDLLIRYESHCEERD